MKNVLKLFMIIALLQSYNLYAQVTPSAPGGTIMGRPAGSAGAPAPQTTLPAGVTVDCNVVTCANFPSGQVIATVIYPSQYGILPTNSATTNNTGFASMKAAMQASRTTVWDVIFDKCPGTYLYTNNRWLWNVNQVIIDATGCAFQNTSTDPNYGNVIPLNNGDFFSTNGDNPVPFTTYTNGYLINTAAAGATSITTTTAANAGNFSAGNVVLINGYDQQQSGYPPNMRYFDYEVVVSANASTGVVTLTTPLSNSYDSRWWDTANYFGAGAPSYGAPRIVNLSRSDYKVPAFVYIRGATFLANPTTPTIDELTVSGLVVIFDQVTAPEFNAVMAKTQQIKNNSVFAGSVSSGGSSGGDKLIDRFTIQDSTIVAPSGATTALADNVGINDLSILRSKIIGNIYQSCPRNFTLDDTDIIASTSAFGAIATCSLNPERSVTIGKTRVYNTGSLAYGFTNVASPGLAFTVGSVSGTTLLMTWNSTAMTVADELDYGMSFTDTTQGCTGLVTGLYLTGGNTLNITQTGCASPMAGDTINFYDVAQISDGGGNVIIGTRVPFWRAPPGPSFSDSPTFTGTTTISLLGFAGTTDTLHISSGGFDFQFNGADAMYIFSGGPFLPNGKSMEFGGGAGAASFDSSAGISVQGRSWEIATTPTATSGFGTSPTVTGWGTGTFEITEGASGSPSTTGVIGLPSVSDGWHCDALDESSASITTRQSGTISSSAATFTFSSAPANSDHILFHCGAF